MGVSLPGIQRRCEDGCLNDARSKRGYATGQWVLPNPAPSLVLEGVTPWNPLFFCLFSNLLRFSGNI